MKEDEVSLNETKKDELEFNTYCTFSNKEQDINQVIELMFKDYLEDNHIND